MSGVRLSRAYMPGMLERNWGRVLFLSSEAGLNIAPDMIHYGFTKTAVLQSREGLPSVQQERGSRSTLCCLARPGRRVSKAC